MAKVPLETFTFEAYDASRTSVEATHRRMVAGSTNQIIAGSGKAQAFKGVAETVGLLGSLYMTDAGQGYGGLGSYSDTDAKGSMWRVLSALFIIGNGDAFYNGASLGMSAASILQLKLLDGGTWSATTYQAGLSQPVAPTLAALTTPGVGFTGRLKAGTYSAKAIKIRSATGVRSLASDQSVTIIVTETNGVGQSARITFPSIGGNGADRWGIYVSARNFGSTGPHYLLKEVDEADLGTVDGVPRSLEIEWSDGDLVGQPLAPISSFPPPAGMFGGQLGDCSFLDGCYGDVTDGVTASSPGSTIVMSLPLRPEEFPPEWAIYPPEPPTALLRGGDGFFYRLGKSTMGVLSYVGSEPPLAFQLMWATTGVAYPHNACVGTGGRLYAKAGANLVRIGDDGNPDTRWAAPVADDMATLDNEKTKLVWDTSSHSLVVMSERRMWVYNEQLDLWGCPIDLTPFLAGDITACVTNGNDAIISAKDDANSTIKIYAYNVGAGTLMSSMSDWHFSQSGHDCLRHLDIVMRADNTTNPVTVNVYGNEDADTPILTDTLAVRKTGTVKLQPIRATLMSLESFAVKLSQQTVGGDAGFELVRAEGFPRDIVT